MATSREAYCKLVLEIADMLDAHPTWKGKFGMYQLQAQYPLIDGGTYAGTVQIPTNETEDDHPARIKGNPKYHQI